MSLSIDETPPPMLLLLDGNVNNVLETKIEIKSLETSEDEDNTTSSSDDDFELKSEEILSSEEESFEEPTIEIIRRPFVQESISQVEDKVEKTPKPLPISKSIVVVTPTNEPQKVIYASELFRIRACLFRSLGNGKVAITSRGRNDGVGAQALGKITTQVLAQALKFQYVHMPFEHLEHVDNGMKPKHYADEWEKLLCIAGEHTHLSRFPHIRPLTHNDLHRRIATHPFKAGIAYVVRDAHSFTNAFKDDLEEEWKTVISELRDRFQYEANEPSKIVNVAVHIRRGDALLRGKAEQTKRVLENQYFINVMKMLENSVPEDTELEFHIISEGVPDDFNDITSQFKNVKLHISTPSVNINHRAAQSARMPGRAARNQHLLNRRGNMALIQKRKMERLQRLKKKSKNEKKDITSAEAFKLLTGSDILIMSKSSFSFLAGLYSKGVKIFPPQMWWNLPKWCEEHDNWFQIDKQEIKNIKQFEKIMKEITLKI